MSDTNEAKVYTEKPAERHSLPEELLPVRSNTELTFELAYERNQVSDRLARLERAIEANPESVSEHHKDLWRKQAEAMRTYKEVLGERIKDLIDNG